MIFGKILLAGFIVLIGAIAVNLLASLFGFSSWYVFILNIQASGLRIAFSKEGLIGVIYLFLIYPFLLGLLGFLAAKICF
jgi:energy-converting hydrogenase Eha subunit E